MENHSCRLHSPAATSEQRLGKGDKAPAREIFPQRERAGAYRSDTISKLDAMVGCDDMEAALSRLRDLLKDAETYRKHAFYESASSLYEEIAVALERSWKGFEDILEDLPE